jgi:glyoxylase-like metal-dependent hydrolase (beta-lactamase superfamily II)/rhodanese-related sulfurtransferase
MQRAEKAKAVLGSRRGKEGRIMIFEQVSTGGCQSYLVGCSDTCSAALIDPEVRQIDRYHALAARDGLRVKFVVDTHTHADHFSATRQIGEALGVPVVMNRYSAAPFADMRLDDGDMLAVGNLRLRALHTPGHTRDSMCLVMDDRVFTGDTLLIGGTGRTDLPTGDPEMLYDSLFNRLLKLDPKTLVYPAHDYKGRTNSTIGDEIASNTRLQQRERAAFVDMMQHLNLSAPTHLTEALRTNMSGGKTVVQLLSEASNVVPFVSLAELQSRQAARANDFVILDVREKDAFAAGHVPGAKHLPRGQLELRVNDELPDPTMRIVVYCEFGKISTLAAATLRQLGFMRAAALDGGMKAWREGGFPVEAAGN